MSLNELFFPAPVSFVAAAAAVSAGVVLARGTQPSGRVPLIDPLLTIIHARLAALLPAQQQQQLSSRYPRVASALVAAVIISLVNAFILRYVWGILLKRCLSYRQWMLEGRGQVSHKTQLYNRAMRFLFAKSNKTLGYQPYLPNLPLPAVEDTVKGFLLSMEPVLTQAEHAELAQQAQAFLASSECTAITNRLRVRHLTSTNYIGDWWLNCAYLRGRESIAIGSNYYCFTLEMPARALGTTLPCARAAVYIYSWICSANEIDRGALAPQLVAGNTPLCMNQYAQPTSAGLRLTRTPGATADTLVPHRDSKHIVVLRKGLCYIVANIVGSDGTVASPRVIETALQRAVAEADAADADAASSGSGAVRAAEVALLTSWRRDKWAAARESILLADEGSRAALAAIESAIMVVSMDDHSDVRWNDLSGMARSLMHGVITTTGDNGRSGATKTYPRWFDKLTLVVDDNANVGANAEHSPCDAPMVAHVLDDAMCFEAESAPYDDGGHCRADLGAASNSNAAAASASAASVVVPMVSEICFTQSEALRAAVDEARAALIAAANDFELCISSLDAFGKNSISKTAKVSPDAFVQLALQATWYRLSADKKFACTYESAMHRLFAEGRTETIRSCTNETSAFVREFEQGTAAAGGRDDKVAARLLKEACDNHARLTAKAMVGEGVDRHLFAMYLVGSSLPGGQAAPEFLRRAMSYGWPLSTSQTPVGQSTRWKNAAQSVTKFPRANGGFAAVHRAGYGVSYAISSDRMVFHVSCFKAAGNTSAERFQTELHKILKGMMALMEK